MNLFRSKTRERAKASKFMNIAHKKAQFLFGLFKVDEYIYLQRIKFNKVKNIIHQERTGELQKTMNRLVSKIKKFLNLVGIR